MKHVKRLGLAAMAAMALMASGAGTASAATSSLYSTGVKVSAGTEIHAILSGWSYLNTTDGKTLVDTCYGFGNTVAGKVEYGIATDAKASIGSLTWGACTVTTDTLTKGSFSISSTGTVTGKESVVTVNFGGVSCRYGTGLGTDLGSLETGLLKFNAVINEQEPKSFICPDTTRWFAYYDVTSPHDLTAGA